MTKNDEVYNFPKFPKGESMNRDDQIKLLEEILQSLREEQENSKPKWEPKKGELIEVKFTQDDWTDNPRIGTFQEMSGDYYKINGNRLYDDARRFICPIQWIERKLGDKTTPKWIGKVLAFVNNTIYCCEESELYWDCVEKWRPITDDMEELRKVFEEEGQA